MLTILKTNKKYFKTLVFIFLIIISLSSCSKKTKLSEFEREYKDLNFSNAQIVEKINSEKLKKVLKEDAIIFVGKRDDLPSQRALKHLLEAAKETGLKKLYYYDESFNLEDNQEVPMATTIFVKKSKINYLHTFTNKEELTLEEKDELILLYINNINELSDTLCDESC